VKTYRDQSLQKHGGIFGNIIFDLLLVAFAVSLLVSPIWFDINDVIYQLNGLKDYIFRNFIPTSLYNYKFVLKLLDYYPAGYYRYLDMDCMGN
jgi:hypothetical protein